MNASVCLEQVEGYLMQEDAPYALCSDGRALLVPVVVPGGVMLVHVLVARRSTSLLLKTTFNLGVPRPHKQLRIRLPSTLRCEHYTVRLNATFRTLSLKMRLPIQATSRTISREELRESLHALGFVSRLAKQLVQRRTSDRSPPSSGPSSSENA